RNSCNVFRASACAFTTTLRALSQLRHHTLSRFHKCPHRCTLVSSQASNRIATLVRRLISVIIDLHIPATWFVCSSKEWIVPFNVTRPLTTHVPYAVLQPNFVSTLFVCLERKIK
ncbi:hypothetical protein, partial [Escherichia coli]|uniref:hypothetical protein n=1 Tax=Escherichia coli TaxID=562 RepID=UPI001BB48429